MSLANPPAELEPEPIALHRPLPGLWPSVGRLLVLRLATGLRGIRRANRRKKIRYALLALLLLMMVGFLGWLGWQALDYMRSPEVLQQAELKGMLDKWLGAMPVLMLAGVFTGLFITSFGVLLQALYLAGDMDFLLSTPVPIRAVFVSKMLQAILPNFALTSIFAVPMLFALGFLARYNVVYYILAPLDMAGLALAAAGLSALVVMSVVRIVPAKRVAEVVGFIGAISSLICSQSGNLARFNRVDPNAAANMMNTVQRLDTPLNPLAWAGRGLTALGRGEWLTGVGFTGLTWLAAAGIFFFSLVTAERLFYSGWAGMQVSPRGKAKKARSSAAKTAANGAESNALGVAGAAVSRAASVLPVALRAIAAKDWMLLRRDLKNLSQILTPLIFGVVYAIALFRDSGDNDFDPERFGPLMTQVAQNASLYGSVALSLFVAWMLTARLAGTGFSQEGKSYWILKTAPLGPGLLLAAKFLVAFVPSVLLSVAYLVIIVLLQGATLGALGFSLLVVALAIAGNTGLNLYFGVTGANLTWSDPRHMQKTGAGCLGAFLAFIYLPIAMTLFFGPALLLAMLGLPEWLGQLIGLAVGGSFSLLLAIVPPALARKKVEQLGFSD